MEGKCKNLIYERLTLQLEEIARSGTGNGIDIESKTKRSFDLTIFSISNRNEQAYSILFWIEKDRKNAFQNFWSKDKTNLLFPKYSGSKWI